MKSIISSIIAISVVFAFSCSDDFLQRNSLSQLSEGSFWKTEKDVEVGVNAIYNVLKEVVNDHVRFGLLDDFSDISYYQWSHGLIAGTETNRGGIFYDAWKRYYKGIMRSNTAIAQIDAMRTSETLNRLKGEALFMRALFYFKLADLFGGVPIYDVAVNFDEATKPRNTVEQVYEFIVKDLTDAIPLLPDEYTGANIGRATKWAAISLRGKTYLYAKDYDNAATDLNNVITNSGRELHPVYEQIFNYKWENNKEIIFDVQFIMIAGYGNQSDIYRGNSNMRSQGWAVSLPTRLLMEEYENLDGTPFRWEDHPDFDPNEEGGSDDWSNEAKVKEILGDRDPRMHQTMLVPWGEFVGSGNRELIYKWPYNTADPTSFASQNPWYYWKKFVHQGDENSQRYDSPNNIPQIRFADVLLMYAEAKNEVSGPDASVYSAINAVRNRVGMPDIPTGSKEDVRERIRHERKVELAGEGIWYSDMRRYGLGVELCNHEVLGFNGRRLFTRRFTDKHYLWPIPAAEIDINPNLTQNNGWE